MATGYLALVLHAHLPFVRHPEYDTFLEERWLFEAITECYLPLICMIDRLISDGLPCPLTLSLSPSLLAMLEDPLLQQRYEAHLDSLIELSRKEQKRTRRSQPHFYTLAKMYHHLFTTARDTFVNRCRRRLVEPFKQFHQSGAIELMTTAATHGLLPLLAAQPGAVEAQLVTGLDYFEQLFGFRPRGMWLPECGYYTGLDQLLARLGIDYFILETHGLGPSPTDVFAPLRTPAGPVAFGRDPASTRQVWSAKTGFPGHPQYREFYRDIGHDLDFEYLRPHLAGEVRSDTGLKYYRITGPTEEKESYQPEIARRQATAHATEFLRQRVVQLGRLEATGTAPVIVAPFDAELFGHWWFEGPHWLEAVIRTAAAQPVGPALTTLAAYLNRHSTPGQGEPATSTWGHNGYFEVWLNQKTDWIYPRLHRCAQRMAALAGQYSHAPVEPLTQRALNQCLRELLLAQSSDWPFIISHNTAADYADRRVRSHIARFNHLAAAIENNAVDPQELAALEEIDNIFSDVDYRVFGP